MISLDGKLNRLCGGQSSRPLKVLAVFRQSGSLHPESFESGPGRIRNPPCGEDSWCSGDGQALVAHQEFEQSKFLRAEIDNVNFTAHGVANSVDFKIFL